LFMKFVTPFIKAPNAIPKKAYANTGAHFDFIINSKGTKEEKTIPRKETYFDPIFSVNLPKRKCEGI